MKTPSTTVRFTTIAALAALFASAPLANAADLTWASGATGTWDTSTTGWNPGPVAWNNLGNDTAVFGGNTSYQVNILAATAISAGGLAQSGTGTTTIAAGAGASLTLAGAAPTIAGTGNITLSLALQGSGGLIKTGSGTLRFNTVSTYAGDTVLNNDNGNGQITLGVNNGLPATTKLTTESGTNFTMQGFTQTLAGLAGNGTVRTTSGITSKVTITGASTDTFNGNINDGTGTALLGLERAGTGVTNLGGTLVYRGATVVSGGTLNLEASLYKLADNTGTSSVTVSGGILTSSVSDARLGVGAVTLSAGSIAPGGASIGSFTLAADRSFTATGGTLDFTLGLGGTSDQIFGSGTGSSFNLSDLTLALGGVTSIAGTYTLFNGFNTGSVSGLVITGLDAGFTGVLGTDGILTVTAIPEPSALAALAGLAALGLAGLRRRR